MGNTDTLRLLLSLMTILITLLHPQPRTRLLRIVALWTMIRKNEVNEELFLGSDFVQGCVSLLVYLGIGTLQALPMDSLRLQPPRPPQARLPLRYPHLCDGKQMRILPGDLWVAVSVHMHIQTDGNVVHLRRVDRLANRLREPKHPVQAPTNGHLYSLRAGSECRMSIAD